MSEPLHPVAVGMACVAAFFMTVALIGDCLR